MGGSNNNVNGGAAEDDICIVKHNKRTPTTLDIVLQCFDSGQSLTVSESPTPAPHVTRELIVPLAGGGTSSWSSHSSASGRSLSEVKQPPKKKLTAGGGSFFFLKGPEKSAA